MVSEDSQTTTTVPVNPLNTEQDWQLIENLLCELDIEELARTTKAHSGRKNSKIPNAVTLVRILVFYVLTPTTSFVASTARAIPSLLINLCAPALQKRLIRSRLLAVALLSKLLATDFPPIPIHWSDMPVIIVDATIVKGQSSGFCGKYANRTNNRIHLAFEPHSNQFKQVIYDPDRPNAGESFRKFTIEPGQLWVGDRLYCSRAGISHVVKGGSDVLVRFKRGGLSLFDSKDSTSALDVLKVLQSCKRLEEAGQSAHWKLYMRTSTDKPLQVRLVAKRLSDKATAKELKVLRESKIANTEEARSMCKYMILITTLKRSRANRRRVLELYRLRWQVELRIKREKSQLGLSQIRCRKPETVSAWVLWHFVSSVLVDKLVSTRKAKVQQQVQAQSNEVAGKKQKHSVRVEAETGLSSSSHLN